MKRINIIYDGRQYSVGRVDVERVRGEIDAALDAGRHAWITVNHGEGRPQPAELLIGPGIPISIIPIPDEDPDAGTVTAE